MAKSLGQIHTVNFSLPDVTTGDRYILDLAGKLWEQLEHRVRQGNFFKVVGIDADIGDTDTTNQVIDGRMFYYSPTRGRCAAYRNAFKAMMGVYSDLGVPARDNYMYDFRVPFNTSADNIDDFVNQAYFSVDGGGEPKVLQLADDADRGIFTVWNESLAQFQNSAGGDNIIGSGWQVWANEGLTPFDGLTNEGTIGTMPSGDGLGTKC